MSFNIKRHMYTSVISWWSISHMGRKNGPKTRFSARPWKDELDNGNAVHQEVPNTNWEDWGIVCRHWANCVGPWCTSLQRENGENLNPISEHRLVACSLGGPWTWWVGSTPVQMSGCCLGAALSWLRDGLLAGGWLFFIDPSFLVNSHLGHSRAWIPACSLTAALLHRCFPFNLSTTTQGAIVELRGVSSELCTLFIWSVYNSKTALARGPRTVLGYVGKRRWEVEGYWCFRKWVLWSPCIGGAKCGLIAANERDVQGFLRLQRLLSRSLPRRRSRCACVRSYVHFVCVCVYMCMCVCVRTCIYVYICMCVCICTSMCLYTCVCVCVCIFVHRLWVSVSVLQRVDSVMHARVCSCAYVCVYICVWVWGHVPVFSSVLKRWRFFVQFSE